MLSFWRKTKTKEEKAQEQALKQEQREAKKRAKAEAKAFEKARIAELKKDREELYLLRKNQRLKIGRWCLWGMIGFIFLKGVIVSVRPDPTTEVNRTIDQFKTSLSSFQEQDNEVLSFAQNFAVQYLTYAGGKEEDYVNRLKQCSTESVFNQGYQFPSGTSANVIYANAYKKESYSDHQMDVWVVVTVEYKHRQQEGESVTEHQSTETSILKVPVAFKDNHYIVEEVPVFVNDTIKLSDYSVAQYVGVECPTDVSEAIKASLTNFYTAYYGQDQGVINYYLSPQADTSEFIGLGGRVMFKQIETLRAYYLSEDNKQDFMVLVTLSVTDKNGVVMQQKFNVKMTYKDNQYYVVEMNTRQANLK